MSLVREALAKAEREAAARAARERGLPEALHAAGQPYRARRRGRRTPALAALLALAALGLGAASYLGLFRSGSTTAVATQAPEPRLPLKGRDETPAGAVAAPERAAPEVAGQVAAADAAEDGETSAPAPATPTPAETHPSLQFEVGAGAATAGQRPPISVDSEKPREGPAPARAREPERFVREAVLDGGATRVALGGIAWSEAAPLAYLNGELRGVGESVAGLAIRAIERDRVVLAARDRTIVVSLR
jgi:hypothetical protein